MALYQSTVLSGVAVYQLWIQLLAPQSSLINSVLVLYRNYEGFPEAVKKVK